MKMEQCVEQRFLKTFGAMQGQCWKEENDMHQGSQTRWRHW